MYTYISGLKITNQKGVASLLNFMYCCKFHIFALFRYCSLEQPTVYINWNLLYPERCWYLTQLVLILFILNIQLDIVLFI